MKEKHTWIIISLDCKVQEVLSKGAKSSPHLKTCYFYFENISVGSTAIFSVALRPGRCPQLHSSPHYSPGNHRSSWVHLLFAPPWPCPLLPRGHCLHPLASPHSMATLVPSACPHPMSPPPIHPAHRMIHLDENTHPVNGSPQPSRSRLKPLVKQNVSRISHCPSFPDLHRFALWPPDFLVVAPSFPAVSHLHAFLIPSSIHHFLHLSPFRFPHHSIVCAVSSLPAYASISSHCSDCLLSASPAPSMAHSRCSTNTTKSAG